MKDSISMAVLSVAISAAVSLNTIEKLSQNTREGSMECIGEAGIAPGPVTITVQDDRGSHTITLDLESAASVKFGDKFNNAGTKSLSNQEDSIQEPW